MIVTATLAWFNEDPVMLHRAVSSLSVIADRLVAVDGRWDLYPGDTIASPLEQHRAIADAAIEAGISAVVCPARSWTGQVEKRNHMLNLASQGSDWVLPLDADWELTGDRDATRHELEHTTADALVVPFHTPANPTADLDDVAATGWHRNMAGRTEHHALIWRALPDMRVERFHWCVYATKNNQQVALWGNEGHCPQADTATLQAPFQITHWCLHRDQRTIQANRDYCHQRDAYVAAHGTEPT